MKEDKEGDGAVLSSSYAGFVRNNSYLQTDLMKCSRILQTSTGKVGEHLGVLGK